MIVAWQKEVKDNLELSNTFKFDAFLSHLSQLHVKEVSGIILEIEALNKPYLRLAYLERLHGAFPHNFVLFHYAKAAKELGETELAISLFETLVSKSANPWHFYGFIQLLESQKKWNKVEVLLEKAFNLKLNDVQSALFHKTKARINLEYQDKDGAVKQYLLALKYHPGNTQIYFELSNILQDGLSEFELNEIRTKRNVTKDLLLKYFPKLNNWDILEIESSGEDILWFEDKKRINLVRPGSINNQIHYSLRNAVFANQWPSFVATIPNAMCHASFDHSYLENENRQVCNYLSIGGPNIIRAFYNREDALYLRGHTAFLSQYFGTINYCHWLLDVVPRIGLLQKCGLSLGNFDHYIFNVVEADFQKDTLNKLEIDLSKVKSSKDYPMITGDKISVPSLHMHPMNSGANWIVEFLQQLFISDFNNSTKKRRIYINRRGVSKRRVLNELELEHFLEKQYGFESITMHDFDVFHQAKVAHDAEIVIGPHGAALTNIVFCNPGTKFIELFSPVYGTWAYFITAQANKMEYYNFIGEDYDESLKEFKADSPNQVFGKKDILVDIKQLDKLLKQIL